MALFRHRPILTSMIALALVVTIVIASYGMFLASEAGRLPWQADPTRIPVTPFSDFPGFGAVTTPDATPNGS